MRKLKLKLEASAWSLVLASLLIGFVATAGTIKVWSTSDTLTASDLNGNFNHIHSLMVGGHGPRLVDGDVSASAAIASSKLAAYRLLPVAWANVHVSAGSPGSGACTGTCSVTASGFASATRSGAGNYLVNFSATRTDAVYVALSTAHNSLGGTCSVCGYATGAVNVCCATSGGAASDNEFDVVVFDNN